MNLGRKIRQVRQLKGWSLAELAKRSGVALSSLSRIETGKMTGTLGSHLHIARALEVRLSELYAGLDAPGPPAELRRAEEIRDRHQTGKGAFRAILTEAALQKKMLPFLLQLAPKKSTRRERGPAGSEKFVYLLRGQLEVLVGEERFRMGPGDSLYLQASSPHSFVNAGSHSLLAVSVTCPPVL